MLLSIIVPVYKVERYIERCILSLVNQDLSPEDYEIIIVDDGSPDKSAEIAETLGKTYANIIVVHKKNGGLSSARNYGMEYVKGKYVMFVDSDDYLEQNVLGKLINICLKYDLDCLGYGINSIKNGIYIPHPKWEKRPPFNIIISNNDYICNYTVNISAWGHIAKKEIYEKNNIRFINGIIHEDYEFMFRFYGSINQMMLTDIKVYNYDLKEADTITTIRTEAQNRRSIESWITILKSLNNWIKTHNQTNPESIKSANPLLNNYKYVALTNLLTRRIPLKDKFDYLRQFEAVKALKIGKSNLNTIRKLCSFIYRIPYIFPFLILISYPKAK